MYLEGLFNAYRALVDVYLGRESGRTGILLKAGAKVYYDGTTLVVASTGDIFESPSFAQAITEGLFDTLPTSVVPVQDIEDLPDPVNGVIYLEPFLIYQVRGTVNLGENVIDASPDSVILGHSPAHDLLVTDSASPLITVNDGSVYEIRNVGLRNTTGPAIFYNGNGTGIPLFTRVSFQGDQPSTFQDCTHVKFIECWVLLADGGIQFDGTIENLVLLMCMFGPSFNASFVGLDFLPTSTMEHINILQSGWTLSPGQIGLRQQGGATVSDAKMTSNRFHGTGTYLSGFTKATPEWDLKHNTGLADSHAHLSAGWLSATPVVFTSPGANTYGIVPGTMVVARSERFIETAPGSNTFRYVGLDPTTLSVQASVALSAVGTTCVLAAGIAYMGTVMAETEVSVSVAAGGIAGAVIPLSVAMDVNPGDEGAIYIKNITNGNNINVFSVRLSVYGEA